MASFSSDAFANTAFSTDSFSLEGAPQGGSTVAALRKVESKLADDNNQPLIGNRQAAITDVTVTGTYATDDTPIETAINAIIDTLEAHGLIESND